MSVHTAVEESITIVNKTYPEWGKKNGWIVCVGGINEKGEWRRLYPLPYDMWWEPKYKHLAFKKWDTIQVKIRKRPPNKDPRKESYEVADWKDLKIVSHSEDWNERRQFIDRYVSDDVDALVNSKYDDHQRGHWTSMGVVRPKEVLDFAEQERNKVNDRGYQQVMGVQMRQTTLFGVEPPKSPDPIDKKIGYIYKCYNPNCNGHDMMCTDWEAAELYRRMGFAKTRQKFFDWMLEKRDLYLMLGTVARTNTFINVGVFYPPKLKGSTLESFIKN